MMNRKRDSARSPRVGLFVTCLVNAMRPSVGFSAMELLERAGCTVVVPRNQTCCGQPGFNAGDFKDSRKIARQVIRTFEPFDYVVVPSGSCAGMIAQHYPMDLFGEDDVWGGRARRLAERTYELTGFLSDIMGFYPTEPLHDLSRLHVTYHDSCSCLREMKVKSQPRKLLKTLCNIDVDEMADTDVCCGFGGTFSVKMPQVSAGIADKKIDNGLKTGADMMLGADMGCLLHLAGRLKRRGESLEVRHVAEVLAGHIDGSAIGEEDA